MNELINAAATNNVALIKQLCLTGLDMNSVDDQGRTALHFAVANRSAEAVKQLVANGANVNAKDFYGETPLHHAAYFNFPDMIALLASLGAIVDATNNTGTTPIHKAASIAHSDAVNMLQKVGSLVDVESFRLRRILFNVFNNNNLLLLLQNADTIHLEDGGYSEEAAIIIKALLGNFVSRTIAEKELQPFVDALEGLINNKSQPGKDKLNIIKTGCVTHTLYAVVKERCPLFSTLFLAERGLFAVPDTKTNKINSITSMFVLNQCKDEIEKKLIGAQYLKQQDAFTEFLKIPQVSLSNYRSENVLQAPFKNGHCYFENLKTLVLTEFIDLFGMQNGKILYKEFDIFMHEKALQIYMAGIKDSNKHDVQKLCASIIDNKKQKLQALKNTYQNAVRVQNSMSPTMHF